MYLYGASGHAKVIIDIIKTQGGVVEGLVDDNPNLKELNGTPVLHDATGLSPFIISIGNCKIRKMIAERLDCAFTTIIHSTAIISSTAIIGEGTVVMQGAIVQTEVKIGKHCIINTKASIDLAVRLVAMCVWAKERGLVLVQPLFKVSGSVKIVLSVPVV